MTQVGNDVYLALTSQDTLVFRNTTIAAFTGDDFQLPGSLPVGGDDYILDQRKRQQP